MPIETATAAHDLAVVLTAKAGHLVNGNLVQGTVESAVRAPWDHSLFVRYNQVTVDEVHAAIAGARAAFQKLRQAGGQPDTWLLAVADRLESEQENFATLISFENGKLQPAARGEVVGAIASLRYWAGLKPSEEIIDSASTHETRLLRAPLGVVAAITPFNMPLLMMVNKIGAALVAGNTIVCKPSQIGRASCRERVF